MSSSCDTTRRFSGLDRLYHMNAMQTLQCSHVVIIGIGGVGSWAAEAIARSGIGKITLIDLDNIAESNINRQLHALSSTIGVPKVMAMQQRILEINPNCDIDAIEDFLCPDTIESHLGMLDQTTWIIDCIDQVKTKAHLIAWARRRKQPIITTGAAGGKTDPTQLKIGDLNLTEYDPLCSRLKQTLKKQFHFPAHPHKFKIPCVYSMENMRYPKENSSCDVNESQSKPGLQGLNCAGYGSVVTVTASMGLFAASYVINKIVQTTKVLM